MAYPDELFAPAAHGEPAPGKRLLDTAGEPHPLASGQYPWAVAHYRAACANHWWPEDVNLACDIVQWQSGQVSEAEQDAVRFSLAGIMTAGRVAPRVTLGLHRHISAPDCRAFLLRQVFEESLHQYACRYIVQALEPNADGWFAAAAEAPALAARDAFLRGQTEALLRAGFQTGTAADDQKLLGALAVHVCLRKGLAGQAGCVRILALGRQNRMAGVARLCRYMLRDEELHCRFGTDLVNQIKTDHPHLWTRAFQEKLRSVVRQGVALEIAGAGGDRRQGLEPALLADYARCVADRRLRQIGLTPLFAQTSDPFMWMAGMTEIPASPQNEAAPRPTRQFGGLLSWE